jgi:hypothetical protein
MKIRLTEKLLWDIYKLIKVKDEIMDALISPHAGHKARAVQEIFWPSYYDIRDYYREQYKEKKNKEKFIKLINYLKNKGYLNIKDLKNRKAVMLTSEGIKKVSNIKIKLTEKKRRKDGKWQMVFFDIPEQRRRDRDMFRRQLKYLGYQKLQQSIWVSPYEVLKETQGLIKNYKLGRFVRLLLVEEIKI